MKVTIVAGARPNFMKIAPVIHAIQLTQKEGSGIVYRLVHTGQHYDFNMSDSFFNDLHIPAPDINLGIGGGTQAEQTAGIMVAFEKELMSHHADWVLVVGDVNSTMACTIVAKKLCTKVAHVESGLRSWDLTMPEEINRMVTDCLADIHFTTSETATANLRNQGIKPEQIHFVGNVMIDTLLANVDRFRKPAIYNKLNLSDGEFLMLTLHRPTNVDDVEKLRCIIGEIIGNVHGLPVVFPIHPRTAQTFIKSDIKAKNLFVVDPMGYLEFNYLVKHCKVVITDSGGVPEEATVMGIPCVTLRDNTERPETCTIGTNELIGTNPNAIKPTLEKLFAGQWKKGGIPELWDGKAAERIVNIMSKMDCLNQTSR